MQWYFVLKSDRSANPHANFGGQEDHDRFALQIIGTRRIGNGGRDGREPLSHGRLGAGCRRAGIRAIDNRDRRHRRQRIIGRPIRPVERGAQPLRLMAVAFSENPRPTLNMSAQWTGS